jgi:2-polyprenyl-3-methyl-5-hydroxy-6-metoxy-1,4-benzoquinol methylase
MIESKHYTTKFFEGHENGALSSARKVIPLVNDVVKPASVIDVGCGVGNWLKVWLEDIGVQNIQGIEGPYLSPKLLQVDPKYVHFQDLKSKFEITGRYDLAMSLEVAEHLPHATAEHFVSSLTHLSDIILFSAAIPGQEGTYHVNEQPPEYWAAIFLKFGYVPVDHLRDQIWNNEEVEWWYQQNLLFYVKQSALANYPALEPSYRKTGKNLFRIHPWIYFYKDKHIRKTKTWIGYVRWRLYPIKKFFKSRFK